MCPVFPFSILLIHVERENDCNTDWVHLHCSSMQLTPANHLLLVLWRYFNTGQIIRINLEVIFGDLPTSEQPTYQHHPFAFHHDCKIFAHPCMGSDSHDTHFLDYIKNTSIHSKLGLQNVTMPVLFWAIFFFWLAESIKEQ